jgi:hypothetical protein
VATLPDLKTLQNELIEIFSSFQNGKPHPNKPLQWMAIRDQWDAAGFRADDFNRLVSHMKSEETLREVNGMYSLTEKAVEQGLISLPTLAEIERAILDVFSFHNSRPGEGILPYEIQSQLFEDGIIAEEYAQGLQSMINKGWLKVGADTIAITDAGFKEM